MYVVHISKLQLCVYKMRVNLLVLPPSHPQKQRQSVTSYQFLVCLFKSYPTERQISINCYGCSFGGQKCTLLEYYIQELDVLNNFR